MTKEFHHITVLLNETVDMLNVKPDGIYVDATLGGAGHSAYLLSQLYVFWIIANEEEMRTMLTPTLLEMATFR